MQQIMNTEFCSNTEKSHPCQGCFSEGDSSCCSSVAGFSCVSGRRPASSTGLRANLAVKNRSGMIPPCIKHKTMDYCPGYPALKNIDNRKFQLNTT